MKNWKKIGLAILAILGGVFYRMGGSGNFGRWIREAGQQLLVTLSFWLMGLIAMTWESILGTVLSSGVCWAESTYFKQSGIDAKWWNWALVGWVFGMVPLSYCALTQSHWLGFGIRAVICIILVPVYQQYVSTWLESAFRKTIGKDVLDEFGRGFINIATLPLLLIS